MKANFLIQLLLLAQFTFMSGAVHGQEQQIDSLRKKFDRFRKNSLQEKLYAHTDRDVYLTGEILWFKIYATDGSFHRPLDLSSVAYIEILDKNNLPVLQSKVPLNKGFGNGSLFLPASLSSGYYTVRFYTNWMKNFSPEFFFHKTVSIINPFVKPEFETKSEQAYSVQFFPEGGNLINGISSKIGFKITGSHDVIRSLKGYLMDGNNDTVTTFAPYKYGLGNFQHTPSGEDIYSVVFMDSTGKTNRFNLPEAMEVGYALSLSDADKDALIVNVSSSVKEKTDIPFVYLFIHARQQIIKAEARVLKNDQTIFTVPVSELSSGINHFTLFDRNLRPVCERLYFKKPTERLVVKSNTEKQFETRKKVKLLIETGTTDNRGLPADVSVSVYKLGSMTSGRDNGILEYLWLSSDLQGEVESPEYYFSDDATSQAIDNLMLTHGWRKFKWNDISGEIQPLPYLPEYRGHLIKGKVVNQDNKPIPGVLTYLSSPGKVVALYGSRSNASGEVLYEMKGFSGRRQVIVQTNTQNSDSSYHVVLEDPFHKLFKSRHLPPFTLPASFAEELLSRTIGMQVQDIFYEERFNESHKAADSIPFYGKADEVYLLEDFTRFPVMEEVMREYVPGVLVRKRRDGFHFIVLDSEKKGVLPDNPLVLLDGVPVFDVDQIMAFDPLNIKKLEVLTHQYYLGPLSIPGIVSYSTYGGDLAGFQIDPEAISLDYDGLQLERGFHQPQYETQKQRSNRLPDQRNLLYWAPAVQTGKDGKIELEFYTSDVEGEYGISVEGLTRDGLSGSGFSRFSVKRVSY